ncbi:MAG: hypothetical protein EON58_16420 [Alphaproteobacteria bacterium]|nr:MAG: hypothetical protein EON58_16420 [Alphaproteobacteria bacterium]
MSAEQKAQIEEWAQAQAREDKRLSTAERKPLGDYARDRYSLERGLREHALNPVWGFGVAMADVAADMGADIKKVEALIRAEVDDGQNAADQFLAAVELHHSGNEF